MRLTLAEHGGFAGGLRLGQAPVVVDVAGLPDADAREVAGLLAAARAEAPPQVSAGAVADGMTWTVTVEDGGTEEVLRRTDATMSRAFAELVGRLRRLTAGA
jgi:hypothetical protein